MKQKWKMFFSLASGSCVLYLICSGLILGWWFLAFQSTSSTLSKSLINYQTSSFHLQTGKLLRELSPIQRQDLHQALTGNFSLMHQLIEQWDQEAEWLTHQAIPNIQRLSPDVFLQAHLLARLIQNLSDQELRELNTKLSLKSLHDDSGHLLNIQNSNPRLIPQTYAAASFLLTIASSKELIALPKGMRYLNQLYPSKLLVKVPDNLDRMHSEKLHLACPTLAFVAPYSHPPTLETFKKQLIPLYITRYFETFEDITQNLLKIGHASQHIIEAQLLEIFMQASFMSLDNRLRVLAHEHSLDYIPEVLYLHCHQHYMQPTSKSLTGQLVLRAMQCYPYFYCPIPENHYFWRIPCDQEKILALRPDYLIVSTPYPHSESISHLRIPLLQRPKTNTSQCIFYLDETVQESPTQYLVLAYFDLCQIIKAIVS